MDKAKDFEKGWEEHKAKKKQEIEEMAMDMDYGCVKRDLYPEDAKEIAKALYLLGYRKIHDGAVVLTSEAYNRLFTKARQSEIKTIDLESIVNARKETAEKYHKMLIEKLSAHILDNMNSRVYCLDIKMLNDEVLKEITDKGVQNGN